MWLPEKEVYFETKGHMLNSIKHLLGGRVAEEIKLDDISTGASNDLQRATETARAMISQYGFSEKLGPVAYSTNDQVFLGRDFTTRQNYSDEIASAIDKEIKSLLESCYADAKKILIEHDDAFERVAQALLLVETIDGEQFEKLYNGEITPEELKAQIDKTNEEIKKKDAEEAEESKKAEEEERRLAEEKMEELRKNFLYGDEDDDSEFVEYRRPTERKVVVKPLIKHEEDDEIESDVEAEVEPKVELEDEPEAESKSEEIEINVEPEDNDSKEK